MFDKIMCAAELARRLRGRGIASKSSLLGFQQSVDLRYQFHEFFRILFCGRQFT
jgi:hypothetical protein